MTQIAAHAERLGEPADIARTHAERLFVTLQGGWTLARAHARAGDPAAIAGYLGTDDEFDRAVAEFAERYATQNQADHEAFTAEIAEGRLEAAEIE